MFRTMSELKYDTAICILDPNKMDWILMQNCQS